MRVTLATLLLHLLTQLNFNLKSKNYFTITHLNLQFIEKIELISIDKQFKE
jgi:hypothetical protein